MSSFDVIIVGGGIVGLSLACGLQGNGLRIAVLEQQASVNQSVEMGPLPRVSSINPASAQLFQYLGVWHENIAQRATAYSMMEVWEKDSFGQIHFRANDYGYSHLGHIIENQVIQRALWQKVQQLNDVTLFSCVKLKHVVWTEHDVFVTVTNGDCLNTKLIIAADGAKSWVRSQANIPIYFSDYQHHALVATVRTTEPHLACARQVFNNDSILAFLPFGANNLCSIVWSLPAKQAQNLQKIEVPLFNQALTTAIDGRLGLCQLESQRWSVPLMARYAYNFAKHRLVLAGDAAHSIHPLAGQGLNLGLMDAISLISTITNLCQQGKDIGCYRYLRGYERSRKQSAISMLMAMQGVHDLFAGKHPVKKLLRNLGLSLTNKLPLVKSALVGEAAGLNRLPEWLM